MKIEAKQEKIQSFTINPIGGLNYVDAPSSLPNEDVRRALNTMYDTNTFILMTRPGLSASTTSTISATPIRKIFSYVKSSTESWLMGAIGTQLYYLSSSAWVSTGITLNDSAVIPALLVFNQKLLVGDGGDIKTWDGSNAGIISGTGHPHPTALRELKSRVVANDSTDLDAIYFSSIEDETIWSGGTSEGVRAGYKDGMKVNAITVAPGGNDLIVSKVQGAKKTIYRINIEDATSTNWYAVPVAVNAAAQPNCLITAMNEVYFCDTNGFKTMIGVTQYGDLQTDFAGRKINTVFENEPTIDEVTFIPLYASIWILNGTSGRIFVYHPPNKAFTDIVLAPGRMRSVCQHGTTIYFAGHNGYLYQFADVNTDETTPGTTAYYQSFIETKQFSFPEAGVLRRVEIYLTPKKGGTASLYAVTPERSAILLKTMTLTAEGEFVYDATGEVYVATQELYEMGSDPWFETSYNKVRSRAIGFNLTTNYGRVGINQIEVEFGMVGGH